MAGRVPAAEEGEAAVEFVEGGADEATDNGEQHEEAELPCFEGRAAVPAG
jgi:hypothetical protein